MQEFTTVSSSSFDPSALATKLTDKSADGWSVVGIVSTGGDVTAFLSRDGTSPAAVVAEAATPVAEPAPEPVAAPVVEPVVATFTPAPPPPPPPLPAPPARRA
ncbi:MAG: hypothetical protein AAB131_19670, partial [Actinomycetota bacterium]